MQINDEISSNRYMIKKCSEEGIVINNTNYRETILLNLEKLISPWSVSNVKDIKEKHMIDVIKMNPKILIIGSGKQHLHINNKLLFLLYSNNIGCETMNSYAACRTYNLLSIDNRNVCCILFPV